MIVKDLVIKELESESGKKYYAVFVVTDDTENPDKLLGYVNAKCIRTIPVDSKKKK